MNKDNDELLTGKRPTIDARLLQAVDPYEGGCAADCCSGGISPPLAAKTMISTRPELAAVSMFRLMSWGPGSGGRSVVKLVVAGAQAAPYRLDA